MSVRKNDELGRKETSAQTINGCWVIKREKCSRYDLPEASSGKGSSFGHNAWSESGLEEREYGWNDEKKEVRLKLNEE